MPHTTHAVDLRGTLADVARLERRGLSRAEAVAAVARRMNVHEGDLRRELDRRRVVDAVSWWGTR